MDALLLTGLVALALIIAYNTYGRWVARRVFQLREDAATPAVVYDDNRDYCPTKRSVVFGHHFTSIAGTGPIVGPAIAVMWGWLPAVLWVVVGAIFIGAVHDLGSLVVSLRNKGRSVGDIAGDLLGPRVRLIFLGVLVMALWIVLAIFGLVIAAVLRAYEQAIFAVVVQVPLALVIGLLIHRRGRSIVVPSICALAAMYATVIWGDVGPLAAFNDFCAAQPTWIWVIVLLGYSYIASVLPVWVLLQPRDYINALQLVTALALLVAGLVGAALLGGFGAGAEEFAGGAAPERIPLELVAPVVDLHPEGAPPMIPILFITIACGAISGFHCLVSSGTTSKQLAKETDALPVGYGSMLTEGFLATLVIVACAAGIGLGISKSIDSQRRFIAQASDGCYFGVSGYVNLPVLEDGGELRVGRVIEDRHRAATAATPSSWRRRSVAFFTPDKPGLASEEVMQYLGMSSAVVSSFAASEEDGGIDAEIEPDRFVFPTGTLDFHPDELRYHLTGRLAWQKQYASWGAADALVAKVGAFVEGAANLLVSIGVSASVAVALMGVLVASFAGTTLDTACRLQRYVVQELARTFLPRPEPLACRACGYTLRGLRSDDACPECGDRNEWRLDFGGHPEELDAPAFEGDLVQRCASPWNPLRWLATRHGATAFAAVTAIALAFIPAWGQAWSLANAGAGGLILWPLFGATNQLLGGLAFVVIGAWLIATKRPVWFIVPPAILMLVLPAWAMALQAYVGDAHSASWLARGEWILVGVATATLALEAWLVVEVGCRLLRARRARAVESAS